MHPILRFLQQQRREQGELTTQRALARAAGLSEGFVSQLVRGNERCGSRAALKIVRATGGRVDLVELLSWEREALEAG